MCGVARLLPRAATRGALRAQHKHLHFYGPPAGRRCFLVITQPKSRTRDGPQMEHATVSDTPVVHLLEHWSSHHRRSEWLWPSSDAAFRRRWNECLKILGLKGFTPAGLRVGCATHLYMAGVDPSRISWALRHKSEATLRYYIQEMPALLNKDSWTRRTRERVDRFSAVIEHATARMKAGSACWILLRQIEQAMLLGLLRV